MIHTANGFGPAYEQSVTFLYLEAELLDDLRYDDWLQLLADDLDYRIPTRVTRERGGRNREFSPDSFFMIDDLGSITARVRRFDTDFAFAEDPPTRTRRIVGNVRTFTTPNDDEIAVKSNFFLARTKDDHPSQVIAGERHDVLRSSEGGLLLARRTVFFENTLLPMENLAIFL